MCGECSMYRCFDTHLLRDPAVWNNVVFIKVKHCFSHNKCWSSACDPEIVGGVGDVASLT